MMLRPIVLWFALVPALFWANPVTPSPASSGLSLSPFYNTPSSQNTKIENPPDISPDDFPTGYNPLTGLIVADPALLERNPVLVKISNAPPLVRPQAGIGEADLVFEHYAEGGLTRFSALYYGQMPERVGSIRSARIIDYELMAMYQSLLAYSGASIGVEDLLNHAEFTELLYKGVLFGLPYYWRDDAIEIPHNMFTNPAALQDLATAQGRAYPPDLRGMAFSAMPPTENAESHGQIDIRYRATRVHWDYDAETGLYYRTSDGRPHLDANTGEQVSAANVVIIYANHRFTDIVESEFQGNVSYSIEIELWFEGDAVIFRDGQRYAARWQRPTRQHLLSLETLDGEIFPLKPGNTFFQVVRPVADQNPVEEWIRWTEPEQTGE